MYWLAYSLDIRYVFRYDRFTLSSVCSPILTLSPFLSHACTNFRLRAGAAGESKLLLQTSVVDVTVTLCRIRFSSARTCSIIRWNLWDLQYILDFSKNHNRSILSWLKIIPFTVKMVLYIWKGEIHYKKRKIISYTKGFMKRLFARTWCIANYPFYPLTSC